MIKSIFHDPRIAFAVLIAIPCALMLVGCTAVEVTPVPKRADFDHVYIIDNPSVTVPDFMQTMRENFTERGIKTSIIRNKTDVSSDLYFLTYTALRSWDLSTYLSYAEISIDRNGTQVGYAQYRLKGKGGFSLLKWQSVETKMDPVFDKLLINYPLRQGTSNPN